MAELRLPIAADRLAVMRPFGKAAPVQQDSGHTVVTIGNRHYLQFRATPAEEVSGLLRGYRVLDRSSTSSR